MRTALFLISGFLLLSAFAILARLYAQHFPSAAAWAVGMFLGVWLLVTASNMWVGVSKAGYSSAEELPVFLLLFGLRALAAVLLKWKLL